MFQSWWFPITLVPYCPQWRFSTFVFWVFVDINASFLRLWSSLCFRPSWFRVRYWHVGCRVSSSLSCYKYMRCCLVPSRHRRRGLSTKRELVFRLPSPLQGKAFPFRVCIVVMSLFMCRIVSKFFFVLISSCWPLGRVFIIVPVFLSFSLFFLVCQYNLS